MRTTNRDSILGPALKLIVGALCAMMVACSNGTPDDPGFHLVHTGGAFAVMKPVDFMSRAGCVALDAIGKKGAVVVGRPTEAGFDQFDCSGIGRDSLRAVARAYKALLVQAKLHGASLTSMNGDAGYWQLINQQQVCSDGSISEPGTGSYQTPDGFAHVLPDIGVISTCWNVNSYQWQWYDDNGGGGGGDGVGNPGGGSTDGSPGFPDGPPLADPPPPPIGWVTLTPGGASLNVGDYVGFRAAAFYPDGTPIPSFTVTSWTSDNIPVATPDGDIGAFVMKMPGTANVSLLVNAAGATAIGTATVTVPLESDDSTTVDDYLPNCNKLDQSTCKGHVATHGEWGQIRDAVSGIVFTNIPLCATAKAILLGLDSTQVHNFGDPPDPNTFAESGWVASPGDSVGQAQSIGIGLYSPVWNGNPKHSFAQTLVHEILHPLLNVRGSGNPSDPVEKQLDALANQCVINHH